MEVNPQNIDNEVVLIDMFDVIPSNPPPIDLDNVFRQFDIKPIVQPIKDDDVINKEYENLFVKKNKKVVDDKKIKDNNKINNDYENKKIINDYENKKIINDYENRKLINDKINKTNNISNIQQITANDISVNNKNMVNNIPDKHLFSNKIIVRDITNNNNNTNNNNTNNTTNNNNNNNTNNNNTNNNNTNNNTNNNNINKTNNDDETSDNIEAVIEEPYKLVTRDTLDELFMKYMESPYKNDDYKWLNNEILFDKSNDVERLLEYIDNNILMDSVSNYNIHTEMYRIDIDKVIRKFEKITPLIISGIVNKPKKKKEKSKEETPVNVGSLITYYIYYKDPNAFLHKKIDAWTELKIVDGKFSKSIVDATFDENVIYCKKYLTNNYKFRKNHFGGFKREFEFQNENNKIILYSLTRTHSLS